MGRPRPDFAGRWSLSARRAWIEMLIEKIAPALVTVALRKESVDRNCDLGWPCQLCAGVALRKESVDRNFSFSFIAASRFSSLSARRAWIEKYLQFHLFQPCPSLSARRAWIEKLLGCDPSLLYSVALRKESVDRKCPRQRVHRGRCPVALRKESVDRKARLRRSASIWLESLSARRAWIEKD